VAIVNKFLFMFAPVLQIGKETAVPDGLVGAIVAAR
jgi:hypothetical protein